MLENEETPVPGNKKAFLANKKNKQNLINMPEKFLDDTSYDIL